MVWICPILGSSSCFSRARIMEAKLQLLLSVTIQGIIPMRLDALSRIVSIPAKQSYQWRNTTAWFTQISYPSMLVTCVRKEMTQKPPWASTWLADIHSSGQMVTPGSDTLRMKQQDSRPSYLRGKTLPEYPGRLLTRNQPSLLSNVCPEFASSNYDV